MTAELRPFWVDLHLHTALSPCGELEMGARDIVARARELGIDVIAVSDHNTCDNYDALAGAAEGEPVILPALEVQSQEDVHVVTIFPDGAAAHAFKDWLWLEMPQKQNDPDVFGDQVVLDKDDEIVRIEDILLIQGVRYEVDTVVKRANECGAITILAHVDRPAFAYPAILGPFPPDYPVDAFELSPHTNSDQADDWRKRYPGRTFIRSSDSHWLSAMGRENCSKMLLAAPTFDEIRKALRGTDGRRVYWPWG
jgi:PHP family Zn ribbon phosphoesterase